MGIGNLPVLLLTMAAIVGCGPNDAALRSEADANVAAEQAKLKKLEADWARVITQPNLKLPGESVPSMGMSNGPKTDPSDGALPPGTLSVAQVEAVPKHKRPQEKSVEELFAMERSIAEQKLKVEAAIKKRDALK